MKNIITLKNQELAILKYLAFLTKELNHKTALEIYQKEGMKTLLFCLCCVNPQKRSAILQKMAFTHKNIKSISSMKNIGDGETKENEFVEHKNSFSIMVDNPAFNICQIRSYQKIDYYQLDFYEITENGKAYLHEFLIPAIEFYDNFKNSMFNCHGTIETNKENVNIERRLTIKKNSEDWKKLEPYRTKYETLQ